jgi:hypothetical protein
MVNTSILSSMNTLQDQSVKEEKNEIKELSEKEIGYR